MKSKCSVPVKRKRCTSPSTLENEWKSDLATLNNGSTTMAIENVDRERSVVHEKKERKIDYAGFH
tara:strand:+ start:304 stop:498 length:195 start_codon:yes stop_codon:yes gene_type:complete